MRFVAAENGRTLTVNEGGDPDGVPVLVHAGTPGSSLFYEPTVRDAAERGIRLVTYDRPGYGGSTRDEGRNIAACASDVEAVCNALEISRFCVWGISGGGPHALATAALLPDRVAAAAALAPVAPFDAEGLDFFDGMGEQNVEEFGVIFDGEDAHRAALDRDRQQLLGSSPDQLVEAWTTLLGPADRDALTGRFAEHVLASVRAAITRTLDGWFDDDIAFTVPWGFELDSIRVPVLHLQGEQDKFVPLGHGVWFAGHIPGVESRITPDDGHLTLETRRIPEVHAWLLERY
jgi:pimeloyl-ACP methyl ester carboxylesterase